MSRKFGKKWSWGTAAVMAAVALLVSILLPAQFEFARRLADVAMALCAGWGLSAVAEFIYTRYDTRENTRNLPLRGVLNLCRGAIWIIVTVISASILMGRSPAYILTGVGAFAAALMLVFKDSILGFVAGIQMAQNDMLHVGDWIVVDGTRVNGIVERVSLSAVKVRNFDNTYVTVPPYTLVSGSFQNYRGMKETGARRFMRTLIIDLPSIADSSPALLNKVKTAFPDFTPPESETNLGLFRAYVEWYLANNKQLNPNQLYMARLLDYTANGVPLEIYAFTNTTDWKTFEAIQSAVTEHLIVTAPIFNLSIYTSGSLTLEEG